MQRKRNKMKEMSLHNKTRFASSSLDMLAESSSMSGLWFFSRAKFPQKIEDLQKCRQSPSDRGRKGTNESACFLSFSGDRIS